MLELVVEEQPRAISSSVGLFFRQGSRDELLAEHGITHLLEHLFFKGSTSKSAVELNYEIERLGGELNAYTDREVTCFYANTPSSGTKRALSLLLEMIYDSIWEEPEFAKEREVILQEITGYLDSPEEEFWDSFIEHCMPDRAVGRRVAGTAKSVRAIDFSNLREHLENSFFRRPCVLVVVSPLSAQTVKAYMKQWLSQWSRKVLWGDALFGKPRRMARESSARHRSGVYAQRFDSDQVHFGISYPGVSLTSPEEVSLSALSFLLGGGASSRLFRRLREQEGLVYSVNAQAFSLSDQGRFLVNFSCDRNRLPDAATLCSEEIENAKSGVTNDDVAFIAESLRGALYLSFEGAINRMDSLGRQVLLFGKPFSFDALAKELDEVSRTSILRVARKYLSKPFVFGLGPVSGRDLNRATAPFFLT